MKSLKLTPNDSSFTHQGVKYEITNITQNMFTELWSFDLSWSSGKVCGVPITTGTSIIRGNGTPLHMAVFFDEVSQNGDVTYPNNTTLYILDKED